MERDISPIAVALESFSDSQTACRIILVGSMKPCSLSKYFKFVLHTQFSWKLVQWIPRTEIERADFISSLVDIDE